MAFLHFFLAPWILMNLSQRKICPTEEFYDNVSDLCVRVPSEIVWSVRSALEFNKLEDTAVVMGPQYPQKWPISIRWSEEPKHPQR